jgi:hypothetical protein
MPEVFGSVCRLFGYASCGSISTFEALILAPIVIVLGLLLVRACTWLLLVAWHGPNHPVSSWGNLLLALACLLPAGFFLWFFLLR